MQNRRGALALAFLCACSGKVIDIGSNQGTGGSSGSGGDSTNVVGSNGGVGGSNVGGDGVAVDGAAGSFGGSVNVGGSTNLGGMSIGYGGAGPMGAGGSIAPWPVDGDCQSGTQLPIVGRWDGYLENYMFPSGSDEVHVVITAANSAHVCGKVTFGAGMPPAPPSDPNVGYPPRLVQAARNSGGAGGATNFDAEIEGYPMTILNGQATSARVQFQIDEMELWKGWCELQTSYVHASGYYSCVPGDGWGGGPNGCTLDNGGVVIDCAKLQLCTSLVCACSANGCTVSPQGNVSFDLHVQNANQFAGSASVSGLHNVYLDRTQ